MNFRIDAYLGSNITLVFDSLDLARVSRDKIRASGCPLFALAFAAMVQPLKVVERVICQGDASRSELTIWTIVNHATEAQRYAIYDKQWDVMQVFQGSAVEFNLVDREDSPLEDLMQWSGRAFVVEV